MSDEATSNPIDSMSNEAIDSQIQSLEHQLQGRKTEEEATAIEEKVAKKLAGVSEEQRTEELGKIYDALQAKDDAKAENNTLPPALKGTTLEDSFKRTSEWMDKTKDERATDSQAAFEIQRIQDRHKALGAEISREEAIKISLQLEAQKAAATPPELAPAMQAIQAAYPDHQPHEIVGRYHEIDRAFKADPVSTIGWMSNEIGMSPLVLAQQLALRYGERQLVEDNATKLVDQWFADVPDAEAFQDKMIDAVTGGKIKRSGNIAADLRSAYDYVQRSEKKARAARPKSFESEMEDVYDKVRARR